MVDRSSAMLSPHNFTGERCWNNSVWWLVPLCVVSAGPSVLLGNLVFTLASLPQLHSLSTSCLAPFSLTGNHASYSADSRRWKHACVLPLIIRLSCLCAIQSPRTRCFSSIQIKPIHGFSALHLFYLFWHCFPVIPSLLFYPCFSTLSFSLACTVPLYYWQCFQTKAVGMLPLFAQLPSSVPCNDPV